MLLYRQTGVRKTHIEGTKKKQNKKKEKKKANVTDFGAPRT
jgi:hypothetical protein